VRKIGVGDFIVTDLMREYVNDILETRRLSYGPYCRAFENQFAKLHSRRLGVLSNSGTSSLQVALQALKELHRWNDGDEVIIPAVTFVATANIVLHNKMKPVLVDVEHDYYGIDPEKIAHKITPKTRAIIPVHLFGMPCDMTSIMEIARAHDLEVLEDSCETAFATHYGVPVGSWGAIGCFSMYVAHIISAGVGGIAITDNPDYAVKMRSLVNHGRDAIYISIDDDDHLDRLELKEVVERRFKFESIGHSYRITEFEAALALAQLPDWEEMVKQRQYNAAYLTDELASLKDWLQLPSIRPRTTSSWMMWPFILREGDKWTLATFLEERGIETREMLRLTDQPCYTGFWNPDDYPVAKWMNEQGLYVGCHNGLTTDDLDYIVEAFEDYFK